MVDKNQDKRCDDGVEDKNANVTKILDVKLFL